MRQAVAVAVACVVLSGPAWAQEEPAPRAIRTGEPVSLGVAAIGTVMVGAGVGVMLYQERCEQVPCPSNRPYVLGGTVVVAAGVTMVFLGLRSRTIVVAPTVGPHLLGGAATIRWGGRKHP